MIKIYHKTIKEQQPHEARSLDEFQPGSWVHAENPSEEELKSLVEKFPLDFGHLRDALDAHEVPRLETEEKTHYIFTRVPAHEENRIITTPLLVAVSDDFLLTASLKNIPLLDRFVNEKKDFNTTQKTKLFIQIFSEITALYNAFLTDIGRKVRGISGDLEQIDNREITQLVGYESVLNDFLSALGPSRATLQNLLSGKSLQLFEQDRELVEDLFLGIGQLIERCQANLRNIVNIREAYSTIVTNNLNRVIKLLTALTVVLTVPTITTGLYGMNVALPFAESRTAFWLVILGTTVISFLVLGVFIRNRWL